MKIFSKDELSKLEYRRLAEILQFLRMYAKDVNDELNKRNESVGTHTQPGGNYKK